MRCCGGNNRQGGLRSLVPSSKQGGVFRKAGYDAPATERDLQRTTLVTLVTAAAAAAAAAAHVQKYKR
jgi:hypothetical protein